MIWGINNGTWERLLAKFQYQTIDSGESQPVEAGTTASLSVIPGNTGDGIEDLSDLSGGQKESSADSQIAVDAIRGPDGTLEDELDSPVIGEDETPASPDSLPSVQDAEPESTLTDSQGSNLERAKEIYRKCQRAARFLAGV